MFGLLVLGQLHALEQNIIQNLSCCLSAMIIASKHDFINFQVLFIDLQVITVVRRWIEVVFRQALMMPK